MRFLKKYKNFADNYVFINFFPRARLLKFKRPKWLKLKRLLEKKSKKKFLLNNFILKASLKRWDRIKFYYKEGLIIKRALSSFYDNSFSTATFKKFIKVKNTKLLLTLFINSLVKPLFKLDVLLWKLQFYNSIFEAKQAIVTNKILINLNFNKTKTWVAKGDIIQVNDLKKIYSNSGLLFLNSFFEIDYYTNTIIVLKDPSDATKQDFIFLLRNFINMKKFFDYIKK